MNTSNFLLFGAYPYIAMAVLIVGSWARYDNEQYTWKAGSTQILNDKGMRIASNLFHIGVLFIIFGHFIGLLMPESLYHHVISTPDKQLLAMVSGGFFGILAFIGLTMLIKRRFTDDRVRANGSRGDQMVLLLLYAQLILGLISIVVSAGHMDGSVMVLLATWAQSIVTFQPAAAAAAVEKCEYCLQTAHIPGYDAVCRFPLYAAGAHHQWFRRASEIFTKKLPDSSQQIGCI